jgi:hypothetical protein
MVERDPEKFLTALTNAFGSRQDADQSLKAQFLYFLMSMSAVPIRLTALDVLATKFQQASINAKSDLGKQQQQNQILFDFFPMRWDRLRVSVVAVILLDRRLILTLSLRNYAILPISPIGPALRSCFQSIQLSYRYYFLA